MSVKDEFESLRQHVRGPLDSNYDIDDEDGCNRLSPETVNADSHGSGQSSSRKQAYFTVSAAPHSFSRNSHHTHSNSSTPAADNDAARQKATHSGSASPGALPSPTVVSVTTTPAPAANAETKKANAHSPMGEFVHESAGQPGQRVGSSAALPMAAMPSNSESEVTPLCSSPAAAMEDVKIAADDVHLSTPRSPEELTRTEVTRGEGAGAGQDNRKHDQHHQRTSRLATSADHTKHDSTSGKRAKSAHTPARRATPHYATPTKHSLKKSTVTAAQIAELLTGQADSPAKPVSPDKSCAVAASDPFPPLQSLDLPLGLLVLYCAAEDICTQSEKAAASTSPPSHTAAAYSLLYRLGQLSDVRRRDRHRSALRHASATEEAKCRELFAAAAKKRNTDAAQQAARAQAVAAAEMGACTFHPNVSPAAQAITGKGTTDFMAKCLEWKEEAARRLQQKYARQAAQEAEEASAAAAQRGLAAPGAAMTAESRRLLEAPEVQERLRARPSLWEAKRPAAAALAASSTADARHGAAADLLLLGAPVGSKLVEQQEAMLRQLRQSGSSGPGSVAPFNTSGISAAEKKTKSGSTVRQFLSRVEEDAERREASAAQLQSRYHNPEMDRYEAFTGQQLFTPNAMPTVWKDGRRVGYEDLTKEEQRDFRAELRRAGLGFLLTHYERTQRSRSQQRDGEGEEGQGGAESGGSHGDVDASTVLQGGVLNKSQQERFIASLQEALTQRERNLERARAQATVEETFRPHLTPRSIRMAQHKIGGKPIYERSTIARDAAAVPRKSSSSPKDTNAESSSASYTAHRERPLPEAAEVFLARNEQWTSARQRRLERLAAMEDEKRYGDCTFSPNRTFDEGESASPATAGAGAASHELHPLDSSREGSDYPGRHRSMHMRQQDELATAADVRLMNELELLRSGAAFRDERFVQAVCERIGVADKRQAMANLSLQSAPRLTSSANNLNISSGSNNRRGVAAASVPRHVNASASIATSSQQISPIARRSQRASASPYAVPSRLSQHPDASLPSTFDNQPSVPMMRTESAATQTPTRRGSHGDADDVADDGVWRSGSLPMSPATRADTRTAVAAAAAAEWPPVEDPWAALDAQTDAILKRHGY